MRFLRLQAGAFEQRKADSPLKETEECRFKTCFSSQYIMTNITEANLEDSKMILNDKASSAHTDTRISDFSHALFGQSCDSRQINT